MRRITIEIDESLLPKHSDEYFDEWVKYRLGYYGGISCENPLNDQELEADNVTIEL